MSPTYEHAENNIHPEPIAEPYARPELTRRGTVEELTQADATTTGSGIPTDLSTQG